MSARHQIHIEWVPGFALGVDPVDEQHRFFAGLINRISDDLASSDDEEYRIGLFGELAAYARFHFASEENFMRRAGFPGLEAHRKLHLALIDALSSKLGLVEVERTQERIDDMLAFLRDWFLHHTAAEDRHFAEFLHREER